MEIFLNLWDELDDLLGACRHVATAAALEAASIGRPLGRAVMAAAVAAAAVSQTTLTGLKNLI